MNKISILGCGWLGKSLAISLINKGFAVKGSTTSEEKLELLEMNGIKPYIVDISDFEEYDSFLNANILIIAITSKDIDGFESLIS
jgi:3-hydroxyisobutyrate dehydrogenase-like beta-hydroxyacid dehydrogenase